MKSKLAQLAFACALITSLLFFAPPGRAQEAAGGMRVERIVVEGNEHVTLDEIKKALPFKVGDTITEDEIKAGSQKILDLGYFQQVFPDYRSLDGGIEVFYLVQENPVVKKIEIAGNEQYGEGIKLFGFKIPFTSPILSTDRIIEILSENGVEEKKVLNVKKLEAGLKAILAAYQEKGYTLVTIGDVELGETLKITLIEGKIEELEVTGLSEELEELARGLIKIRLNEPVKVQNIQASLQRINNSIYFEKTGPDDISFSSGSAPDRVILMWNLREREFLERPQVIRKIDFSGATLYSSQQLTEALGPLPEGEVDNLSLLQALQGVYDLYHQNGYTMMDLANGGIADETLRVNISEGTINEIRIEGNTRTKEYVIRRRLRVQPGDLFNENRLRDTYRNLQQLGYFQSIDVNFEEVEPGKIDLIFTFTENKNLGSFNGGLTFAGGGLVGKLSLSWKNIFGTGQDLSLGYDKTLVGGSQANWHFDYTTTTFFPNYDFLKASLYQESEEVKEDDGGEYTLYKSGFEASLGYPLGRGSQLTLGHRYENSIRCPKATPGCTAPETTSSVTLGLSNDDRNDLEFPREGGIRSLSLEQAGAFTAGTRFTKLTFALVQHFPTLKDQNVAVRLHGGQGFSTPAHEQFLLGNVSTLRGISSFRTEKFFLVNAEYRAVLTEGAVGVIFADLGIAEGKDLKRSFGFELRAQLPAVGTVRLVFAWPVVDGQIGWQPKIDFGFGNMF
ncbi:MAG: BamA/TamA family outer membrane protein [Candidatus Acetothermia bacterium]|nr:BamA/TamA family outer membrane protein [Candidatus Acetothermia bacterium]MDH7506103.1 POTRA domain-containing protein [Candidatus Acetothermia bacterium]